MDDGERLLGIGQVYPVRVKTYISQFKRKPNNRDPYTIDEKQLENLKNKQTKFETVVDGRPPEDADFMARAQELTRSFSDQEKIQNPENDETDLISHSLPERIPPHSITEHLLSRAT